MHIYLLQDYGYGLEISVIDAMVSGLLLGAACILVTNSLRFYRPQKDGVIYLASCCISLTLIWLFISKWIVTLIVNNPEASEDLFDHSMPLRACFSLLIIGLMGMIGTLWYTHEDQQIQLKRKSDIEKLAKEAELNQLRQQLQPHFLFNSLNSITALINIRPEEARKMIHQLADFLRGTLKKDDNLQVNLADELEHLALYLEIEKVRFGHRLHTEVHADEQCKKLLLPPMLLQPLVENAIKFGLYDTIGDVTIVIKAHCENQLLRVSIANPYDGQTAKPLQGTGFGLSGVQRRLYLLFSRNDLLETQSDEHQFITTVKIPQA